MATPAFSPDEIRANRDYFAAKLKAEKQRNSVLKAVEGAAHSRRMVLHARRHCPRGYGAAESQGDRHLLLEPRLTAFGNGSSAVGGAWFLRQGNERGMERMDGEPSSDAPGKTRRQRSLRMQQGIIRARGMASASLSLVFLLRL